MSRFERGVIYNRRRAMQIRDFSGLRYGNITPTDIDGYVEFGDRIHIAFELKRAGNELPYGQRLALQRLANMAYESGRVGVALVAEHTAEGDIPVAECIVTEYWYRGEWRKPKAPLTIRAAIDTIIERYNKRVSSPLRQIKFQPTIKKDAA